jgi:hypothetical protein
LNLTTSYRAVVHDGQELTLMVLRSAGTAPLDWIFLNRRSTKWENRPDWGLQFLMGTAEEELKPIDQAYAKSLALKFGAKLEDAY